MASRASWRSQVRSSGVYSAWALEFDWTGSDSSDGGDIALFAPAENERATPGLDYMAIDLRPEGVEVISCRDQRQNYHKPNGETRDPVDGENISAIHGKLRPAVVENNRNNGNDLHDHFELAEIAGFDGKTFGCGNGSQAANQKFAPNDDHGNPRWNHARIELHQGYKRSRNEEFVGKGIQQHAHGGNLPAPTGDVAVDAIRDGSGNEQRCREQLPLSVRCREPRTRKHPYKHRNAQDTDERDGIRQVHGNCAARRSGTVKLCAST